MVGLLAAEARAKAEHTRGKFSLQWSGATIHSRFVIRSISPELKQWRRVFAARRCDGFVHLGQPVISLGCETRTEPSEYVWDGLGRGDDPAHPRLMLQVTLGGWGVFETRGKTWRVDVGQAFFAILPSAHVYRLPVESPVWSFFWLNSGHPWVVERGQQLAMRHPPVFALAADAKLMAVCRSFFTRICQGRFEDAFAEEMAMLEWMLELERHLYDLAHPRGRRERLLEELRAFTQANLGRTFGIEEFARQHGLSRSHFSHQFREATGLAPAAFVLETRLAEARRMLRESGAPLKDIAERTGFADANHLCKAFRRVYHVSPGAYRRLVS
jgi:AraC-like DNA-binding protein